MTTLSERVILQSLEYLVAFYLLHHGLASGCHFLWKSFLM